MDCSPPGSSPMGFSKQEYRSGLLFPSPGHLPDSGIEHGSPAFQADPLTSEPPGKPCFREVHTVSVLYRAHLCMKRSLGISNFLEEISSLSHSIVFFHFFALITEEGFLISPCYFWNSAFKQVYLSFSPLPLASLLFSAIFKASADIHFTFLHYFSLGDCLDPCPLYNVMNLCP